MNPKKRRELHGVVFEAWRTFSVAFKLMAYAFLPIRLIDFCVGLEFYLAHLAKTKDSRRRPKQIGEFLGV